jgi:hypothetical protein
MRENELGKYVALMGDIWNTNKTVDGKSVGMIPFESSWRTLENNIKIMIKEIRCEGVDWTNAAHKVLWRAVANTVINLWVK